GEGGGGANPARQPDGGDRDATVLLAREVVGGDRRLGPRIRALQMDAAAARRPQIADGGREGREGVQRVAEAVEGQRLHMVLQVRGLARRIAPGEGAEL